MHENQQLNAPKILRGASFNQRITSLIVFFVIAGLFGFLKLAAEGIIDLGFWFGPCGFKQDYDLPCPTCGMTTAALAFVQGRFIESFWIQPACWLMCFLLVFGGIFAIFTAIWGKYFGFISRLYAEIKIKYIILALLVIVLAGWLVTLSRAMAVRGN